MFLKTAVFSTGFVILMMLPAQSVDFPNDLKQWYVTMPPEEGSDQLLAAHMDADHEWVVTSGEGAPQVSTRRRQQESPPPLPFEIKPGSSREGLAGRRTTAKVDDGWIVGFDAGEFGAGLWWFSPDGRRRHKISNDHILSFVTTTPGLVAVEGLEHGTISKGKAVRLSRNGDGHWSTELLVDFGEAPQVAIQDGDGLVLVATSKRLLRFSPASKKTDILLDKTFWGGLYPNSMVITPSGTIFVGMRHGVAKIEKDDKQYKISWLLPTKKFADTIIKNGFR